MERVPLFDEIAALYLRNGFSIYLVGGSSRDHLLGLPIEDYDLTTDCHPLEARKFLMEGCDFTFEKYGRVTLPKEYKKAEITTFRKEGEYKDFRHPSGIEFVKDPEIDSRRRDFTINAIYIDPDYRILDFHGGVEDLRKGLIRTIGDPMKRFKEDPLRICRAERLASRFGFEIEETTKEALKACYPLLDRLNPEKLKEEERKGWKWQG